MQHGVTAIGKSGNRYSGLWRRLLISIPGDPVDTLTQVDWVQGLTLFVDLRQPMAAHAAVAASCLDELTREECVVLAQQEGFAGRFILAGDAAEWVREIDFQPPLGLGDRGRLETHGELVIEHGLEADYIEYWQREAGTHDGWAARLQGLDDGQHAILVRCGNRFGFARGGRPSLKPGECLVQQIVGAELAEARRLLDREVATGTVHVDGWRIDRSTMPWRVGAVLLTGADLTGEQLVIGDIDENGQTIARRYSLTEIEGVPSAAPLAPPKPAAAPQCVLPVVDISTLGRGDSHAEQMAVAAIRAAASSTGYFAITGHGIAPAVSERLQAAARRFFDLPLEAKMACYIGQSSNHRGYVPEGEEVFSSGIRDRKEAFDLALDLSEGAIAAGHPMLGPNQWPALPGFREDVMAWYAAAYGVGQRMLRGFALALGQPPEVLGRLVSTPPSQLRMIHYPYQPELKDAPGIGAHTDYECFTLLSVTGPGLEVMTQAGEWIDVPPVPGALMVNIGDMFEFWSGGAFVATSHRVRKVPEERYSFPLFFALDYDVELKPVAGDPDQDAIHTGEHLFAQTAQTFRYLQQRRAAGEVTLPATSRPLSSFGQEAQHSNSPQASR